MECQWVAWTFPGLKACACRHLRVLGNINNMAANAGEYLASESPRGFQHELSAMLERLY
jgi:hypothetical protein